MSARSVAGTQTSRSRRSRTPSQSVDAETQTTTTWSRSSSIGHVWPLFAATDTTPGNGVVVFAAFRTSALFVEGRRPFMDNSYHISPDTSAVTTELAWAAGFFDGEGSTGSYPNKPGGPPYPRVQIKQSDREVLDRFHSAVGVGHVLGPYPPRGALERLPTWSYAAYGAKNTQHICDLLWPFLSSSKQAQFRDALMQRVPA